MKKFLSAVLAALLLFSLTSCKGGGAEAPETGATVIETAAPETEKPAETIAERASETETAAESPAETEAAAEVVGEIMTAAAAPEVTEVVEVREAREAPQPVHLLLTRVSETGQAADNRLIYTTEYPAPHLNEKEADAYAALSLSLSEDEKTLRDLVSENRSKMTSNARDFADDPYFDGMHHEIKGTVLRADTDVISIKHDFNGYFGGAHGDYTMTAYNYDAKTGRRLSVTDVVTDTEKLRAILAEKLKAIPDVEYFEDPETALIGYAYEADHSETGKQLFSFAVGHEAMTFWFNPYELSAYAFGIQEIVLPYAEYPDLFKPEYTTCSDAFFEPVDPGVSYQAGELTFSWEPLYNEYGIIGNIGVTVDGTQTLFDTHTYSPEAYLAKNDGNYYLYVFEDGEDDEQFLDVIGLMDGTPVRTGKIEAGLSVEYDRGEVTGAPEGVNASQARNTVYSLTDPKAFLLSGKTAAEYHIGADGLPEKN